MDVQHVEHRRSDVFRVSGRIDSASAPEFERMLMDSIQHGRGNVVVNLRDVEFVSSAFLRALIAALKETRGRSLRPGNVVLAEVPPRIREVFDLAALSGLFTFYDDETQAVGSF